MTTPTTAPVLAQRLRAIREKLFRAGKDQPRRIDIERAIATRRGCPLCGGSACRCNQPDEVEAALQSAGVL